MGMPNWPLSNTTHGHSMASIGQQKLSFQCVYVWSHMMLRGTLAALTQTYRPGPGSFESGNLHNKVSIWWKIMHSVLSVSDFCICELLFSYTFENVFVLFSSESKRSNDWVNEFAGHKWFIVERERKRDRISKPFSYFQNGLGNLQLDWAQISDFFYLFTTHKGLILGLLEPPM